METIAVYRESRIKTYGFQRLADLALIELSCPLTKMRSLGEILYQDDLKMLSAKFITAQASGHEVSFYFCLPVEQGRNFYASLEKHPSSPINRYIYPVGIIFFYGPDFGDRYGIAEATFSAISKEGIQIIASGCASSSVFLILAQDDLESAEQVLTKTFEVAK